MRNQNSGLRPGEGLGDFMAFTTDAQQRRRAIFSRLTERASAAGDAEPIINGSAVWWPVLGERSPVER